MHRIKRIIREKEYIKHFLMFFSGTLFAQMITIALSPFLTRIYSPSDFGLYGTYIAIVSLLIVFVTGRYEYAINTAETEKDAIALYKIVNHLSIFTSGFIFIILLIFGDTLIEGFGLDINRKILYLIPITLLVMGSLLSSTYYLNRHKKFPALSKSKVLQSLGNGTSAVVFGLLHFGAIGLIVSNIIGVTISQFYQKISSIKIKNVKIERIRTLVNIKKYKQFPLYNAPSAFFDSLAAQAPIFILLRFFTESAVGFYSLTVRVIGMPLSLISTSISQVFLSQVSEMHRNNKSYKFIIIKLLKVLALIGLIPLLILFFWGPILFSIIFGKEWIIAGEYARILSIGYYFKFIISPLSMVFFINKRVRLLSVIQTIRAFTTFAIMIVFSINFNLTTVLYAYTIHEILFYLIYLYYILRTSK